MSTPSVSSSPRMATISSDDVGAAVEQHDSRRQAETQLATSSLPST
jgi:hypothetical protein